MKAFEQLLRADKRRLRAQALVAEILHIVGRHFSDEDHRHNAERELSYELFDKLTKMGVEIITDQDRAAAGLPPRGPDGWTMEELSILEQRRLELMRSPSPLTVADYAALRKEIDDNLYRRYGL